MGENIFGTDGVRDIAGQGTLIQTRVKKLGLVIGHLARTSPRTFVVNAPFLSTVNRIRQGKNRAATVLLAMDTRVSSPEICRWLTDGLLSAGVSVVNVGLCTTPALAFLSRLTGARCGIVVSASHNPPEYNGIKLISPQGAKVDESCEGRVTRLFSRTTAPGKRAGSARSKPELLNLYTDHYRKRFRGLDLHGKRIVLDLANGATIKTAERLLKSFGAEIVAINDSRDGRKINVGCGAEHTATMSESVVANKAFIGFSFDGDGDRVIACDEMGKIVDGDGIIAVLVKHLISKDRTAASGKRVVGTVMTNFGLEVFLKKLNVGLRRANVGDKYVFRDMNEHEALIGGEPSGHIISLEDEVTGDGVVNALLLLEALQHLKMSLAEVHSFFPRMHQVRSDLRVSKKIPIGSLPTLSAAIAAAEERLAGTGRVVVRYSGTEPVLRIMVECEDRNLGTDLSSRIRDAAQRALN